MLLFGVPHRGLLVDDMIQTLVQQKIYSRKPLLDQIDRSSDALASQLIDFVNIIQDRRVISFYEVQGTKQLQFVCSLHINFVKLLNYYRMFRSKAGNEVEILL
jgi:hypothetical protein